MKALNAKLTILTGFCIIAWTLHIGAQAVEVQGELKVTQMPGNDTVDDLVIRNANGSLGTRSVASLPPPPPPIDTARNLASDFELAKYLCDCPNVPPFMIRQLINSGYTMHDLAGVGVPQQEIIDAIRFGSFVDPRDNQFYKTVTIGSQTWMAENLNYGTRINGVSNQTDNGFIEKYCYADDPAFCNTYGGLYQWDEMMQYTTIESTQGVCPSGWHLPSDAEWTILEEYLGMCSGGMGGCSGATGGRGTDQGSQLAGNEALWSNGALDGNGTGALPFGNSGFDALPAGERIPGGIFVELSVYTTIWSSTESGGNALMRGLTNIAQFIQRDASGKSIGRSVRCIKD